MDMHAWLGVKVGLYVSTLESILGAHFDKGSVQWCYGSSLIPELDDFYRELYSNNRNYMLGRISREKTDWDLSNRTKIFYLKRYNKVVSAARILTYPFEVQQYFPDITFRSNYVEISRLGMLSSVRKWNASTLVVVSAFFHAVNTRCEGLYALVRSNECSLYSHYGLTPCSDEVIIESRDSKSYVLLSARIEELVNCTEMVIERISSTKRREYSDSIQAVSSISSKKII